MKQINDISHYYAVIMAGGGGTRLWPLSRARKPKQMLKLSGERTLFQMAVDRLDGLFTPERIFIVTVADQAMELQKQCPEIPVENYLLEPMPRGTASVVGLAATVLAKRDPQAYMAVLTADHFIENVECFQELILTAMQAAKEDYLVTLGIRPTYPATGYGYIERKGSIGQFNGREVFQVEKFREKPHEDLAREFVEDGMHDWNSGMFFWKVERILEEFKRSMPELSKLLEKISADWTTARQYETLEIVWPTIKPETIDYGIMEKAARVAVVPAADLGWNDVGSWDSLFDVLPADQNGNILIHANHLGINSDDSLFCSENPDRMIVTIGMKDIVVVDTGDALLICPRAEAQRVRDVVNLLKQKGYQRYL